MRSTDSLAPATVRRLRAWVDADGADAVAASLGVHAHTVARWTAGGGRVDPLRRRALDAALARRRRAEDRRAAKETR